MDKFPLMREGKSVGELTAEQEALYTWFEARCRLSGGGLWCAWVVGERGELRLGVLEPVGDRAAIRRRFSRRMTDPLGRLLRGEVRPAEAAADTADWEMVRAPELLFRTPWLCQQLRGTAGALTRRRETVRQIALPYDARRPFPLTQLFCLASVRRIGGEVYAVFTFDQRESPVISGGNP